MDFIPLKSELQVEEIEVHRDPVLKSMIKDLSLRKLIPGIEQGAETHKAVRNAKAQTLNG